LSREGKRLADKDDCGQHVAAVAFHEFVIFLEPEYRVLCRHTFCARLDGLKAERAKSKQEEMASAVAITTDIWTSMTNEPYISLTASYIIPDWQLVRRSLSNEAIEQRHTQIGLHCSNCHNIH